MTHSCCRANPHRAGMSALGHKRTFGIFRLMSALPPKADIDSVFYDVRFVPKADSRGAAKSSLFGQLVAAREEGRESTDALAVRKN
jgi:hypothetical protein